MRTRTLSALPIALALAIAGCVTPPEDVAEAAAAEQSPAAATVTTLSFEGALGAGVLACTVVGACVRETPVASDRIFSTDREGTVDLELTMTWDATTPPTERLVLGYFTCDPGMCETDADLSQSDYTYDVSPIAFEARVAVPEGETLFVFMNVGPTLATGPAYVRTTTPQAFLIEGTATGVA